MRARNGDEVGERDQADPVARAAGVGMARAGRGARLARA
jgi:hypothetical protein